MGLTSAPALEANDASARHCTGANATRNKLIFLLMLSWLAAPATAQVSIGIGLPNVSIGINLQTYPQLVPVPGYPVYYAPQLRSNYFFCDGVY